MPGRPPIKGRAPPGTYDKKVEQKRNAFNPAVEISYLTQEEQTKLYDAMECNDATPSLGQAIHLKKLSQAISFYNKYLKQRKRESR